MGRWKTCHKHMQMYQTDCKQCMREERDALRAKLGTAERERDEARAQLAACRKALKRVRSFLVAPHEARWDYPFHAQVRLAFDAVEAALAATEQKGE